MAADDFPKNLPQPDNYFRGLDDSSRPRTRNVIVFLRTRATSLQNLSFSNQSHHRHVLILVLDRSGSVIVDGTEVTLQPGQGLLVRPFQFHHYVNLEHARLRWLFITFDLEAGGTHLPVLDYRILNPDPECRELWSRIAHNWIAESPAQQTTILPMLDLLLMRLVNESPRNQSYDQNLTQSSWIAEVEQLLIQSIHNHESVEQIAERLNLSGRRLRTLFQEQTGVTLRRYRANYQVNRAMELMNSSNKNLGQVAEQCGFQSLSVFTRFIRRETGMTPGELRRSLARR